MQHLAALCFSLAPVADPPDWIELIPAPGADGLVRGRDGRAWRMPSAETVAARFDLRLPLDINHSTELLAPKGGEAPAAAWIEELQARNGALWGRTEWTELGAGAVRGKQYRFISPVFTHSVGGEIHALTSAGLTNTPNFKLALNQGALTPALSRKATPGSEQLLPGDPGSAGEGVNDEDSTMLTALLAALGLAATATEADAVTAINALKTERQTALNSAASPPLEKFVPRAQYDAAMNRASTTEAELKSIKDAALTALIEGEVDAALKAGKIAPATRDDFIAMCRRDGNTDLFKKFIANTPVVLDPAKSGAEGDPTKKAAPGTLTEQQKSLCARMGVSEADYLKSLGVAA
ncbi:MAG: phage protease [Panacagrimonas sp.]